MKNLALFSKKDKEESTIVWQRNMGCYLVNQKYCSMEMVCNLHSPMGPLGLRVSPCGLLKNSLRTLCQLMESLWTPHGLQVSPCGLLVDSG
jgi:hypothetical protein